MKKNKRKYTIGEHILTIGFVVVYVVIVNVADGVSAVRRLVSQGK